MLIFISRGRRAGEQEVQRKLIDYELQQLQEDRNRDTTERSELRELVASVRSELLSQRARQEDGRNELEGLRGLIEETRAELAARRSHEDGYRTEVTELRTLIETMRAELVEARRFEEESRARAVTPTVAVEIRTPSNISEPAPQMTLPAVDDGPKTEYDELTRRIGAVAQRLLPESATVLAITKGDEVLPSALGRRTWHFPQTQDGTYAGHYPADSAEAIAHLEELRSKGGQYLLIPSTAFWWLGYYSELQQHLSAKYDVVHRDESCLIYRLAARDRIETAPVIDEPLTLNVPERQVETKPLLLIPSTNGRHKPQTKSHGSSKVSLQRNLPTVVIPVYNAFDDLQRCVDSLLRHGKHPHQVLLIDDRSPDERIWPFLQFVAAEHKHIHAIQNEQNLGYTATVNNGCRLAPSDAVLLNSDTEVTEGWLEKLAACAYSAHNVATVTPLSNAAGAFSVPKNNAVNDFPEGISVDVMANIVGAASEKLRPSVPTGNGFCMYITRKAINAVGYFDIENFPRGYGEENDFCARAVDQGWLNLVDDSTYIFHRRSASFGESKSPLIAQSRETLKRLHPDYHRNVREWLANDPLDPMRGEIERRLAAGDRAAILGSHSDTDPRTRVLVVLHDGEGGTVMTTQDLMRGISAEYRSFLLRTSGDFWMLFEYSGDRLVSLRRYPFPDPWEMYRELDENRIRVLKEICAEFKFDLAHVRHLIGNGPQLLDELESFGVPIIFSFHDFYTVCPTIQLVDNNGNFCAGTCTIDGDAAKSDCNVVARLRGRSMPALKHQFVHVHRQKMAESLSRCNAFVTTSESARDVLLGAFPALDGREFQVIEHGRDIERARVAVPPESGKPAKIVCLGNIDRAKGADLITRLLEINQQAGQPFEFHFLGAKAKDFQPEKFGGIYHGRYERDQLEGMLREIGPSFSMIASLWPETYCHTLTESWAAGIPVLCSNIGTLTERVKRHGGGWLLDQTSPDNWFAEMLRILDSPVEYAAELGRLDTIALKPVMEMASDYRSLYRQVLETKQNDVYSGRSLVTQNGRFA